MKQESTRASPTLSPPVVSTKQVDSSVFKAISDFPTIPPNATPNFLVLSSPYNLYRNPAEPNSMPGFSSSSFDARDSGSARRKRRRKNFPESDSTEKAPEGNGEETPNKTAESEEQDAESAKTSANWKRGGAVKSTSITQVPDVSLILSPKKPKRKAQAGTSTLSVPDLVPATPRCFSRSPSLIVAKSITGKKAQQDAASRPCEPSRSAAVRSLDVPSLLASGSPHVTSDSARSVTAVLPASAVSSETPVLNRINSNEKERSGSGSGRKSKAQVAKRIMLEYRAKMSAHRVTGKSETEASAAVHDQPSKDNG